jgi:Flp pilus assembly protein TadG
MKRFLQLRSILADQQGATAILVGLTLIVLVGFLALAIDAGYVWVAQNELQNAADAGALAGARFLINDDGTINTGANQIAYTAATANDSTNIPVEVNWSVGNSGDVQRGHWSFATHTFTPNANTTQTSLWLKSKADLDADVNFINAVRVVTRRQTQPVNMFIAGILGHDSIEVVTDAVAYIGFTGNHQVKDVDQPIAICLDGIIDPYSDLPTCTVGRFINSGSKDETNETGGWTNFQQQTDDDGRFDASAPDPCLGGANAQEVTGLVCGGTDGNTRTVTTGLPIGTIGGEAESTFKALRDCWRDTTGEQQTWPMNLPVIKCAGNNVDVCEEVLGMVPIEVVWITGEGNDPHANGAPYKMHEWGGDGNPGNLLWECNVAVESQCADGHYRWNSFVTDPNFNLKNKDGDPAPYANKTLYFKPNCDPQLAVGGTGGGNFGMLAERPKLVE